jgi:membrane dipeptidase
MEKDLTTNKQKILRLNREAPLTDVHAHPSTKAFMFRRNLWKHYCSGKMLNPMSSRSDFKSLEKGGIGVVWISHFLPQRQFFKDCCLLRLLGKLFMPGYSKLTTGFFMQRLLEMMDKTEGEIKRKPNKIELARSAADVKRIRAEGKIAVIHTVEGAHMLDGNLENLDILAQRGVALLTLNHFYPNDIASHVDAIPKKMFIRKICKFNFQVKSHPPLTELGRQLLQKMNNLNIIVDISHCSPEARAEIYTELDKERPIVASHIGVAKYNPHPYNLTDDDIREIARHGGAIGIFFMSSILDKSNPRKGLPAIWRTIKHVHHVTNSYDNIMLGTDFDGFTDPPDDVCDESQLGNVTKMLLERGLAEVDIKKIIGQNAQRILEKGWQ